MCKYATKTADFEQGTATLVDWYEATKGSRLWGTWGTFYNAEELKTATLSLADTFSKVCPHCGHANGSCPGDMRFTVLDHEAARMMYDPDTDADPPHRARVWREVATQCVPLPF